MLLQRARARLCPDGHGIRRCRAVVLGYELCGCSSHFAPPVSGFYDRPPLTTKVDIQAALGSLSGMKGVACAREALKEVCEGSASPMETLLCCALTLPARMGGGGFSRPQPNFEVVLDEVASALVGRRSCRIDLACPAYGLGIEYDSSGFHQNPARDRARREALAHMGYQVVTFDPARMRDFLAFRRVVGFLGDAIPRRRGGQAGDGEMRALLHSLAQATRLGLGLERALFSVGLPPGAVRIHV